MAPLLPFSSVKLRKQSEYPYSPLNYYIRLRLFIFASFPAGLQQFAASTSDRVWCLLFRALRDIPVPSSMSTGGYPVYSGHASDGLHLASRSSLPVRSIPECTRPHSEDDGHAELWLQRL